MRLFFYDCETGGLDPATCGLTEVSSVVAEVAPDFSSLDVVHRFSSLVSPVDGLTYSDEALAIQNRSIADLIAFGRPEAEVLGALGRVTARYFGEAKRCSMVAQNSSFDYGFLDAACIRTGVPLPTNRAHVCAMHLWRSLRFAGHHDCYKANLDAITEALGVRIPDEVRHTATGDVEALAACYVTMLRMIRAR